MGDNEFLTPRERAALEANPEASLASEPQSDHEILKGDSSRVDGILGFLIVVLVALVPILAVVLTYLQHAAILNDNPYLTGTAQWRVAEILDWAMAVVRSGLSVAAGLLLSKRFRQSTPRIVVGIIWLLSVGIAVLTNLLASALLPSSIPSQGLGSALALPTAFAAIWTAYLMTSKEVKSVYCD